MPVSDDFLDFLLDQLSGLGEVVVRRMFGGAGLYREGKISAWWRRMWLI
jgi:DNA transformation protein and related proteins